MTTHLAGRQMRLGASLAFALALLVGAHAHAAPKRVALAEGATAEALVLAIAGASPGAERCVWRESGKGLRVAVADAELPGVVVCDPAVVGPALAGRTRSARVHLGAEETGTVAAVDTYGEPGAFFPLATERELSLGGTARSLWDRLRADGAVFVPPGPWTWAPARDEDPACAGVTRFTPEEIVATLGGARERMQHCWRRGAKASAFTFDVVTDREGGVQPKLVAALRSEPPVVTCLASALALVRFDAPRARCHPVRTQWPVTSPAR